MQQAKFSVTPALAEFLGSYATYGFKDKSSLVQAALTHYRQDLEMRQLREGAELYAEIYGEDREGKELTDAAIEGWPE